LDGQALQIVGGRGVNKNIVPKFAEPDSAYKGQTLQVRELLKL
jgi:hypothetical protein